MNWLLRQAKTRPGETALCGLGFELTWAELAQRVQRTAAALEVAGMERGSRVAVLADSKVTYVTLTWAAMWTGTTLVPLNPQLSDTVISWQLAHSGTDLLVFDRSAANRNLDLGTTRFVQIEELTSSHAVAPVPMVLDAPATMLYTSGTSGDPRLVRLSWRNHEASATANAMNLGVRPDDNWLCCLPLYHVGGLAVVLRSAIYGTRATLFERFDPATLLEHLERDVTIVSLVPTMLRRLVQESGGLDALSRRLAHGKLRAILLGGGAADPAFIHQCLAAGLPIVQTYGMTETGSQVATMPPEFALQKIGSSGFPLFGAAIEIRSADGEPLRSPGTGVIWVRGPMVATGYVNAPAAQQEHFFDGWFKTGDLGELDDDGFLWVHGRHDDVIVTGGEKVAPDRIEQVIARYPTVTDVAVFGVADVEWGQRVVAAVVTATTVEELDAWCRGQLADYERPREWRIVESVPRTSTGKVQRARLASAIH